MPETPGQERSRVPLLVHIGYHKTGTTWLQTGLFEDRTAGFCRPWTSRPIREQFVLADGYEFDSRNARKAFLTEMEDAQRIGLVPVMTDERLSGSPHAGGFDSAWIAERLRLSFPEARVLAVIREQREVIYSVYQQYVRDGGAASLAKYLMPRRTDEVPQFRWEHYEYHRLISRYVDLFGRDQVLVLPFEWLRCERRRFLTEIFALAGLKSVRDHRGGNEYRSFKALTLAIKRRANRLLVRTALNPSACFYVKDHEARFERVDRWVPGLISNRLERRMKAWLAERVGGRYAESNSKTEELIGLDLEELGYEVEPRGERS